MTLLADSVERLSLKILTVGLKKQMKHAKWWQHQLFTLNQWLLYHKLKVAKHNNNQIKTIIAEHDDASVCPTTTSLASYFTEESIPNEIYTFAHEIHV